MNRHDTDCVTIRCQRTRQPGYDAFKLVFAHFLLWLVQYNKGGRSLTLTPSPPPVVWMDISKILHLLLVFIFFWKNLHRRLALVLWKRIDFYNLVIIS